MQYNVEADYKNANDLEIWDTCAVMNGNEIVSVFQKYLSHFLQNVRFKWKGFGTSVVAAVLFLVLNCFSFSFVL